MAYLPCVLLLSLMLAQPVLRASALLNTLSKEHTSAPTGLNNVLFVHSGFSFLSSVFPFKPSQLLIILRFSLIYVSFLESCKYVTLNGILYCLYA